MNRRYGSTSRVPPHSPPRRGQMHSRYADQTVDSRKQKNVEQDLNIDEFGDMGSDEDDFTALTKNFVLPKPPPQPQYNLVPYGLLRDDDDLEEDYDGVPIDDAELSSLKSNSPRVPSRQSDESHPHSGRTSFGNPMTTYSSQDRRRSGHFTPVSDENTIGTSFRSFSSNNLHFGNFPSQEIKNNDNKSMAFGFQGVGRSSMTVDNNATNKQSENFDQRRDRWDQRLATSVDSISGNLKTSTFLRSSVPQSNKPFGTARDFVPAKDSNNRYVKGSEHRILSENTQSLAVTKDHGSMFTQDRATTKDYGSMYLKQPDLSTSRGNFGPKAESKNPPIWAAEVKEPSHSVQNQVSQAQHQIVDSTADKIDAALLQQAWSGLSQMASQTGLSLIGAQNLLMQANPSLGALMSTNALEAGLAPLQTTSFADGSVGALLQSSMVNASIPSSQPNFGQPTSILPSPVLGSSTRSLPVPDGSGAIRYPVPDLSSLVFDPSTGYRYDASTGLHYDANSGYFFNSELKLYLSYDKFTQTYLRVDNPIGITFFNKPLAESSTLVGGSSSSSQSANHRSSTYPLGGFLKETNVDIHSPGNFASNIIMKSSQLGREQPPSSTFNAPNFHNIGSSSESFRSMFPGDSSSQQSTSSLGTRYSQQVKSSLSSGAEPKVATLPNYVETSLFNKLRKAKLAAASKPDPKTKRWGSPDPLLTAAQKLSQDTQSKQEKPKEEEPPGLLDMNDILQRCRQYVKQKTSTTQIKSNQKPDSKTSTYQQRFGKTWRQSQSDDRKRNRSRSPGRPKNRSRSPVRSRDQSHSRSTGKPRNRSGSAEKPLNSARPRHHSRSAGRPSKGSKSPENLGKCRERERGGVSPPLRFRRSASKVQDRIPHRRARSRGRSPGNRARTTLSPEAKKRKVSSQGKIAERQLGKSSKSPDPSRRGRDRRGRPGSHGRSSKSPNLRKRFHFPRTPERKMDNVIVILDESPGGSEVQVGSPEKIPPHPKRCHPEGRSVKKSSVSLSKDSPTKDKTPRLKTPLSETCQNTISSDSSSDLRVRGKDKHPKLKTSTKPEGSKRSKDQPSAKSRLIDTGCSADDEKHGRANQRLVSERTFANAWRKKTPESVFLTEPSPKSDSSSKSTAEKRKDSNNKISAENKCEIGEDKEGETNDFDFLNETLDDDEDSIVIDEYEEILDYQDLEDTSIDTLIKDPASAENQATTEGSCSGKSQSKELGDSLVIREDIENRLGTSCSSVDSGKPLGRSPKKSEELSGKGIVSHGKEKVEVLSDRGLGARKENESTDRSNAQLVKAKVSSSSLEGKKSDDNKLPATCAVKQLEPQKEITEDIGKRESALKPEKHTADSAEEWNVVDSIDDETKECTDNTIKTVSFIEQLVPKNTKSETTVNAEERNIVDSKDGGKVKKTVSVEEAPTKSADYRKPLSLVKDDDEKLVNPEGMNEFPNGHETRFDSLASNSDDRKPDAGNAAEANKKTHASNAAEANQKDGEESQGTVLNSKKAQLPQRSVSEIENFLLLSSQVVEANLAEPSPNKNDQKSGIFSRLGNKFPTDEPAAEPTEAVLPGDPIEPLVPSAPSQDVTLPVKNPVDPKKSNAVDPVAILFDDVPTNTVLIGPMKFFEPRPNFLIFTHNYMRKALAAEKFGYKALSVHHEDRTGAPYHYILIAFKNVQSATKWYNKHGGRYRCDEKIFKTVNGHAKQKMSPDVEGFIHFTERNWVCKGCKLINFPPRSLCFGCFQNKDLEGFTPLTVLDVNGKKKSKFLGLPKLKFFATKESVISSTPPLGGFTIKRIDMVMDENMGMPAGICVFEMTNFIDAGKLKKFLTNRGIEAVYVDMHEEPSAVATHGQKKDLERRTPDDPLPGVEVGMSHVDMLEPSRKVVEKPRRFQEDRGGAIDRRSRDPSKELQAPMGGPSPGPSRKWSSKDGLRSWSPRQRSPEYPSRQRSPEYLPPRRLSPVERVSPPEDRFVREISLGIHAVRDQSPRRNLIQGEWGESRPFNHSRPSVPDHLNARAFSRHHSPEHLSLRPVSRPTVHDAPRYRSPSPRYRSSSPVPDFLPKPSGSDNRRYPPPDPRHFRFEPRSGLDYDSTTKLYYDPKSCCFFNDDTNEWLEYDPRTERYILVR